MGKKKIDKNNLDRVKGGRASQNNPSILPNITPSKNELTEITNIGKRLFNNFFGSK